MLKSIWAFLNGNKTIIGFALLNITQLSFIQQWLGVDLVVVQALLGVLTGASLAHHIKKKKFTDKTD